MISPGHLSKTHVAINSCKFSLKRTFTLFIIFWLLSCLIKKALDTTVQCAWIIQLCFLLHLLPLQVGVQYFLHRPFYSISEAVKCMPKQDFHCSLPVNPLLFSIQIKSTCRLRASRLKCGCKIPLCQMQVQPESRTSPFFMHEASFS